ncbi:unnamed protein product [Cylicocyclus nassatus]|uniref:Uncharacterized protein n=1 Tax=Cylicocyclus nassatus TaxID=53992 RepID=A0AA36DTB5_CYLNA|nr:unnamed protein product [Cylicocyclus nassatus]
MVFLIRLTNVTTSGGWYMVLLKRNKQTSASTLTSLTQSTTQDSYVSRPKTVREESWVKVNPRLEPRRLDGGEVRPFFNEKKIVHKNRWLAEQRPANGWLAAVEWENVSMLAIT